MNIRKWVCLCLGILVSCSPVIPTIQATVETPPTLQNTATNVVPPTQTPTEPPIATPTEEPTATIEIPKLIERNRNTYTEKQIELIQSGAFRSQEAILRNWIVNYWVKADNWLFHSEDVDLNFYYLFDQIQDNEAIVLLQAGGKYGGALFTAPYNAVEMLLNPPEPPETPFELPEYLLPLEISGGDYILVNVGGQLVRIDGQGYAKEEINGAGKWEASNLDISPEALMELTAELDCVQDGRECIRPKGVTKGVRQENLVLIESVSTGISEEMEVDRGDGTKAVLTFIRCATRDFDNKPFTFRYLVQIKHTDVPSVAGFYELRWTPLDVRSYPYPSFSSQEWSEFVPNGEEIYMYYDKLGNPYNFPNEYLEEESIKTNEWREKNEKIVEEGTIPEDHVITAALYSWP